MIDLQEPKKHEYSEEERMALKEHFVLILHTLLLIYLILHNFLIPAVTNLLTHRPLLTDLHFWFLFQIPVQYFLRKKMPIPSGYFYFLLIGTGIRIVVEIYLVQQVKSWSVLSLMLSELSSLIFYYLYFPLLKRKTPALVSLLAFLIIPSLSFMEIRTEKKARTKTAILREGTQEVLGCKGSNHEIHFPLEGSSNVSTKAAIISCGFSDSLIRVGNSFKIENQTSHDINLRLYRIHTLHGKVSWRFLRLVKVPHSSSWDLSEYLSSDSTSFLIKSPERRKLGSLILLPKDNVDFPLGMGKLTTTYETLQWSPNE